LLLQQQLEQNAQQIEAHTQALDQQVNLSGVSPAMTGSGALGTQPEYANGQMQALPATGPVYTGQYAQGTAPQTAPQ